MPNKKTSKKIATTASKTLRNPKASKIQKKLAGSALSQSGTSKTTGKSIEKVASKALKGSKYNSTTKKLAGSVVSQSSKKR